MKSKLVFKGVAFLLPIVLLFLSCKKEPEEIINNPPFANAGLDRIITFPQDTVHLDGSSSKDADGTITTYKWEKTAGPQQFTIANANTPKTAVTGLKDGEYVFQLTVTDNAGHSSKDLVQVSVNGVGPCSEEEIKVVSGPGELKAFGSLSLPRSVNMAAAVADKMVFAGGYTNIHMSNTPTDRVDIYNFTTKAWSTAQLSGYDFQQTITVGNKILFTRHDGKFELYDATANSWTLLSSNPIGGRSEFTTAVLGTKVFFAGGFSNDVASRDVNIFDVVSNTWSVAQLSEARGGMIAAVVGNKLVLAGGFKEYNDFFDVEPSKKVDIYDGATNTWSTADLPQPVVYGNSAVAGSKAVFAFEGTNQVSIFDAASNSWSKVALSLSRDGARAISIGNKILIAGGSSRVDIYDAFTGNWSVANMSRSGDVDWFAGVGNKLLLSLWNNHALDSRIAFEVFDAGSNTFAPLLLSHSLFAKPVVADGKLYFGGSLIGALGERPYPSCKVWQFEFK